MTNRGILTDMATWRRRLLDVLPKIGLHVTDLGPGAVVLSRRSTVRARKVESGAWVVSEDADAPSAMSAVVPPRGGKVVPLTADAALVVRSRKIRKALWDIQQAWYRYLTPHHVAWILDTYGVNCVLDVGANKGQYAKSLRRAGYRGRIASFEPLPHIYEELERAAADDPEWHVYPYALGKEDTTVPMHVVSGTMSSILPPSDFGTHRYKRFGEMRTESVEAHRLDGLLDELVDGIDEPRPYLKLDTQGYDLEAFAGLGERVHEFVGMQSEVALVRIYADMTRMPQAVETYESAGFEITGMFPVSREKQTGRALEYDCVMVRPDVVLEGR